MLMLKGKELSTFTDVSPNNEKIDVSNNLLKDLNGIESCQEKLSWLNASHNQLESIKHLKVCTKLNVLNLGYNKIHSTNHLKKLRELKALIVNNNKLEKLEVVSGNQLDTLDISSLSKLQKLSASHNNLEEFPNLQFLKDVKDLKLNNNKIKLIPDWLANCKRIKVLDIGNNKLADFQSIDVLRKLPLLENLNLKGNPLCEKEEYHIKMKELFPNLKLLDYKKLSDLYFKAIDAKAKKKANYKSESKKECNKNTDEGESNKKEVKATPLTNRGFKSEKFKQDVGDDVSNAVKGRENKVRKKKRRNDIQEAVKSNKRKTSRKQIDDEENTIIDHSDKSEEKAKKGSVFNKLSSDGGEKMESDENDDIVSRRIFCKESKKDVLTDEVEDASARKKEKKMKKGKKGEIGTKKMKKQRSGVVAVKTVKQLSRKQKPDVWSHNISSKDVSFGGGEICSW
ncbi:dynein axonemal assembly factor 1-like isoform X2 [Hydractinia symbiolongicarpus]|uniref:dynein axonemal assembly factor 1-like isoform X2 n=1 Tax=Hydractinia symbiolongicarpus TaxID=13093 RepID=UPI00254FA0DD|nr:dynein axonemal assembly factor 1-like isoform X2 [Hydractinia symbiolongicarpus]